MQNVGRFKKSHCFVKATQICKLLFEPLAQLTAIELKVLKDALCDSCYDVEVNYKIGLF